MELAKIVVPPMHLTEHYLWPMLRPYCHVEEAHDSEGIRHRFEFSGMPDWLEDLLEDLRIPCARCHAQIAPIRSRSGPIKRYLKNGKRAKRKLYYASTCSITQNSGARIGCSRGNAASWAYTKMASALGIEP